MYMILPTNSWAAFLESFSWNSDPTLSISSTCWWRRNGYLVAKEQNQWTQCWKKHNAWNCSQICWICTIIHAGSKWFSRLLPVKFIAPSSNQGACHSGWRAAGWTCWFGWGSGVMAADGLVGWLVGWCEPTNQQKQEETLWKNKSVAICNPLFNRIHNVPILWDVLVKKLHWCQGLVCAAEDTCLWTWEKELTRKTVIDTCPQSTSWMFLAVGFLCRAKRRCSNSTIFVWLPIGVALG